MDLTNVDIVYFVLIGILYIFLICAEVQIKAIKTMLEERWIDHQEPLANGTKKPHNNSKKK